MASRVVAALVFAGLGQAEGADQAITWKAPYDGPASITVGATDEVNISWSGEWPHDLYEFESKEKFDSCDFTGATELVAKGTSGEIILSLTAGHTHYLGCNVVTHCSDSNQKMSVVVADHAITWKAPYDGPASITVGPMDKVQVSWSGEWPHDLHEFESKEKFDSCDFTGATELVAKGTSGEIILSLTAGHTHYLGCSVMTHCSDSNQKMSVQVVDHAITWKAPYDGPASITVGPTDKVYVSWSGDWPHDLYEFESKAKFDSCDFTGATQLVAKGTSGEIILSLTAGHTHYLGCNVVTHCSDSNQKMSVEVSGDDDDGTVVSGSTSHGGVRAATVLALAMAARRAAVA